VQSGEPLAADPAPEFKIELADAGLRHVARPAAARRELDDAMSAAVGVLANRNESLGDK
jgi:hypothetical protein